MITSSSAVLAFFRDFKITDLTKVSYKQTIETTDANGVKTIESKKKLVPVIPAGASKHTVIYCVTEFFNAKDTLHWTQGPKCFENILDIFEDPQDRGYWDLLLATDASRSVVTFKTFIKRFIKHKFADNTKAWREHRRFLSNIQKTRSLSPHEFAALFKYHNSTILPLLPGAPADVADAIFTEDEVTEIILNAMPKEWVDSFEFYIEAINNDPSLEVVLRFMETKARAEEKARTTRNPPRQQSNGGNTSSNNRNTNSNGNSSDGGRRNRGGRNRGGRNSSRNNNGRNRNNGSGTNNRRISDNDTCPLPGHSGHKWGQCFLNANNPNRNNRSNGNNNSNSNNNNGNNRDNHVNENQRNGSNSNNDSSNGNPQASDNHYCQFIDDSNETVNLSDLFHPDHCEDDNYYSEDLQRFPTSGNTDSVTQTDVNEAYTTFSLEENENSVSKQESQDDQPRADMERLQNPTQDVPIATTQVIEDLAPTTVVVCNKINNQKSNRIFLKTLFDSGSTDSIITRASLPKDLKLYKLDKPTTMQTAQGTHSCTEYCVLQHVALPELSLTRRLRFLKCLVIDSKMNYNLIVGRKYMKQIQLQMDFAASKIEWFGKEMSFHPRGFFSDNQLLRKILSNEPYAVAEAYANQTTHVYEDAATKYERTDLEALVKEQDHLSDSEKQILESILTKHPTLFAGLNDRQLGIYPNREYTIELKNDAKPFHIKQPYSIPLHQQEAVKKELQRQVDLDIIEKIYATEWGMPMFIIPKPDGSCRLIADFRELNKATKQLHYPLPKIQDIFHRRKRFKYVTLIDVSMQFHTFKLDAESQKKAVIVSPYGKYCYKRLPMGFLNSPSWAQGAMDELFSDMPDVEVYIDDVGIFSNDLESHQRSVEAVLTKLEQHNFTVKPAKCHWFQSEAPWLGHIITPEGIKPNPKKIQPILNLEFPKTITELRSFIGMVNFYRAFWKRRADLMAPLTALSGRAKGKFTPTPEMINAFNEVKKVIAQEVLLTFPDPNLPIIIKSDASDKQLGAVIKQRDPATNELKTIAFYSRKLSKAQLSYPTIDKEMLCIVEVLKEYRAILWGAEIHVYTDHINLTRQNIASNRIMTWRMLCEEFAPIFHYIKGPDNIEADALSRLPFEEKKGSSTSTDPVEAAQHHDNDNGTDSAAADVTLSDSVTNPEDLFINYPADLPNFPLAFEQLQQAQQEDEEMQNTKHYTTKSFYDYDLKVYTKNGITKIVVPKALLPATVKWYHHIMGHAGAERLQRSISQLLYAPGLQEAVRSYCRTCDACQRYKNPGLGVGHVPAREESKVPFEQIAIDTIGPWSVNIPGIGKTTFNAYSIICTCSNLLELKRATQQNPTGRESVEVLEDTWLSRYPKPVRIIYDQGKEYANIDFESFLISQGIKGCPSTVKNPQSNAILERVHDTMKSAMRTETHANPPRNIEQMDHMVNRVLASTQYAVRACVNKTYGLSPGSIVFHRDMLLPVPIIVNLQQLRERRQVLIDQNNLRENRRRRSHDYNVGDQILILTFKPNALEGRAKGPYTITQVHSNGTVSYMLNEAVIDRINIRRIKPYYRANAVE